MRQQSLFRLVMQHTKRITAKEAPLASPPSPPHLSLLYFQTLLRSGWVCFPSLRSRETGVGAGQWGGIGGQTQGLIPVRHKLNYLDHHPSAQIIL